MGASRECHRDPARDPSWDVDGSRFGSGGGGGGVDSVLRGFATNGFTPAVYDLSVDDLSARTAVPYPAELANGPDHIVTTASDRYLVVGGLDDLLAATDWNDGSPGAYGANFDAGADISFIAPHPTDESIFLARDQFAGLGVYQIDPASKAISLLFGGIGSGTNAASGNNPSWNDDGTRFVTGTGSVLSLWSWDGTTAVQVDTLSLFGGGADRHDCSWVRGTDRIFVGSGNHTQIALVDSAGDTLSLLTTAAVTTSSGTECGTSPDGQWAVQPEPSGTTHVWQIGASTLTPVADFPNPIHTAVWAGNNRILTMDDSVNNIEIQLWSWDGATLAQVALDTVGNGQRVFVSVNSVGR